jgi:hypothetical protein
LLEQRRRLRATVARNYKFYGWLIMVTSFFALLVVQASSTMNGLVDGQYSVLVATNVYGENYIELALEVLAIPAVISTWRRVCSQTRD